MMPRLSGFEVLHALQAIQALRHIPIVVVSAMQPHEAGVQLLTFPGVRKVLNKAAFSAADILQLTDVLLPHA
jgi:CheY-like chemotaxis protein